MDIDTMIKMPYRSLRKIIQTQSKGVTYSIVITRNLRGLDF